MQNHQEHINIFRSLFKGREDVFAVRWEKGGKSGYMPAYFYDPYRFRKFLQTGKRQLKVYEKHVSRSYYRYVVFPEIRLCGKWRQEMGFICGQSITV